MYFVQYVLERDTFGSGLVFSKTVNGNETSLLVENLLPGAIYLFRAVYTKTYDLKCHRHEKKNFFFLAENEANA